MAGWDDADLPADMADGWSLARSLHAKWCVRDADSFPRFPAEPEGPSLVAFGRVVAAAGEPRSPELPAGLVDEVNAVIAEFGGVGVEAAGVAVDEAFAGTYLAAWRRVCDGGLIEVGEGDHFPVSDLPRAWLEARFGAPSDRPQSVADRDRPVRHVRTVGAGVRYVFDFRHEDRLRSLFENVSVLMTHHVNSERGQFRADDGAVLACGDGARAQSELLDIVVSRSGAADVVVLPELSVPEGDVARLMAAQALRDDDQLVVWGSHHREVDGVRRNVAYASQPGGEPMTHHKFDPFVEHDGGTIVREAISVDDVPTINVFVAGPFRFAIAICRDLLTDAGVRRYIDAGVNVLAVPAMSAKTSMFRDRLHQYRAGTQGIGIVANAPLVWPNVDPSPSLALVIVPARDSDVASWAPTEPGGAPWTTVFDCTPANVATGQPLTVHPPRTVTDQ